MSLYSKRGVSAQKEEVHAATRDLSPGLFPKSFCKIFPDALGGQDDWINVMHADGAGTKSILAYLYWKETGDLSVWRDIAEDAIVMNLDDLICVGIYDNLLFSSTIDRNKQLIPGEVLEAIISGTQAFFDKMEDYGIHFHFMGGETADVGDIVRTIAVNGTITARWPRSKLITNERIQAGDCIVGLASFGKASYETAYNSGIGSNGLTSARHDVLNKTYSENFSESFDPGLDPTVIYTGQYQLTEKIRLKDENGAEGANIPVGKLLLSPTRTFAPVIKEILETKFDAVHGLIHCSGGGQTKCLKYLPDQVNVIKDNLFKPPPVFDIIKQLSGSDDREMYQVFNMGTRLEIYTAPDNAQTLIDIAGSYGIDARTIGRVEKSDKKELTIKLGAATLTF